MSTICREFLTGTHIGLLIVCFAGGALLTLAVMR